MLLIIGVFIQAAFVIGSLLSDVLVHAELLLLFLSDTGPQHNTTGYVVFHHSRAWFGECVCVC